MGQILDWMDDVRRAATRLMGEDYNPAGKPPSTIKREVVIAKQGHTAAHRDAAFYDRAFDECRRAAGIAPRVMAPGEGVRLAFADSALGDTAAPAADDAQYHRSRAEGAHAARRQIMADAWKRPEDRIGNAPYQVRDDQTPMEAQAEANHAAMRARLANAWRR